jgi:hypothetical protein
MGDPVGAQRWQRKAVDAVSSKLSSNINPYITYR